MPSITIVLGAGFSQSLGIPGTRQISELVERKLENRHGKEFRDLRDRLHERFGDSYNFEVLAAALEACEPFGKPNMIAEPYASVLPQIAALRDGVTVERARDMYEILMGEIIAATSTDWTHAIAQDRCKQIAKCFDAFENRCDAVEIATLNYDQGAETFHRDYVDGFVGDGERQYFDTATFLTGKARTRIGHLHGCIAYGIEEAPKRFVKVTGPLEPRRVQLWTPRLDGSNWTGVITGSDKPGKLAMPPYNVYFAWLADQLLKNSQLLIIGYGIGDYHLNVWFSMALRFQAKQEIRCVIIDCFDPKPGQFPASASLYAYATGEDSILSADEQAKVQFKDGIAQSGGAMLIHTGFPLTDAQLDEVVRFMSS
jgi:hypothetical protein